MSTGRLMQCGVLEASDSSNGFSCTQLFIYFFLSLTEREQRSERLVFLCSSLEIEGQSKVPFLVVLDCSLLV